MYAVVLMGKNTMIRKAIRGHLEKNPLLEKLLPHIKGNIGFVFTKEDLKDVRDMIQSNQVDTKACDMHSGDCVNVICRLLLQLRLVALLPLMCLYQLVTLDLVQRRLLFSKHFPSLPKSQGAPLKYW